MLALAPGVLGDVLPARAAIVAIAPAPRGPGVPRGTGASGAAARVVGAPPGAAAAGAPNAVTAGGRAALVYVAPRAVAAEAPAASTPRAPSPAVSAASGAAASRPLGASAAGAVGAAAWWMVGAAPPSVAGVRAPGAPNASAPAAPTLPPTGPERAPPVDAPASGPRVAAPVAGGRGPLLAPVAGAPASSPAAGREQAARWGPPIAHSLALMAGLRGIEAYLYPEPFARTDPGFWGERYRDAFTKPPLFDAGRPLFRWDGDPWPINVIGHGLMGSEYYARARVCRASAFGAFVFAAGASAVWEYGFEANGVRPSGLDLVYTPLAGVALGEARYQAWRAAAGVASPGWRRVLRGALDPFGELERGAGLLGC